MFGGGGWCGGDVWRVVMWVCGGDVCVGVDVVVGCVGLVDVRMVAAW